MPAARLFVFHFDRHTHTEHTPSPCESQSFYPIFQAQNFRSQSVKIWVLVKETLKSANFLLLIHVSNFSVFSENKFQCSWSPLPTRFRWAFLFRQKFSTTEFSTRHATHTDDYMYIIHTRSRSEDRGWGNVGGSTRRKTRALDRTARRSNRDPQPDRWYLGACVWTRVRGWGKRRKVGPRHFGSSSFSFASTPK